MKDLENRNRKKNFQAKVQKEHGSLHLKITHNGYQWQGLKLNHSEMKRVVEVLEKELKNAN
jgi:hypothetical protein